MATAPPRTRYGGIQLDRARLEYELARRGLRWVDLARESGLTAMTLSHARHRPVTQATLEKITAALLRLPVIEGADLILSEPGKKEAAA